MTGRERVKAINDRTEAAVIIIMVIVAKIKIMETVAAMDTAITTKITTTPPILATTSTLETKITVMATTMGGILMPGTKATVT